MIAAIYARKSTSQDDAEDEAKSVNRQVENARVFATARGWTVLDEHVCVDRDARHCAARLRLEVFC